MTIPATTRKMLNKVPEVTLYFWIIKILCTTVGETAADFLNVNLNAGLTVTSVVTGALLLIALVFQFRSKRYVPGLYWLTVALVSVFGTLVTDNLTDNLGLPLEVSTVIFTVLLGLAFLAWYLSEKTLSMHSIFTTRRESFYWLAILLTFALGTASGDLLAEGLGLGYLVTGLIVASLILIIAVARRLGLHAILAFWIIYIFTRPLGASIGDFLSQPPSHGGLGLGPTNTSIIFFAGILGIVTYLSVTKKDVIDAPTENTVEPTQKGGLLQTAVTLTILLIAAGIGYHVRLAALQGGPADTAAPAIATGTGASAPSAPASPLGDLSAFRTITKDTLDLVNAGNQSGAQARITDLEFAWDNAQAQLKRKDTAAWNKVDGAIDLALRQVRAVQPNTVTEKSALQALLNALGS
jgi:uncharacterized membrane-anchored protein